MADIAAIAAGLTDKQRGMLIMLVDSGLSRVQYLDGRTLAALDKRGLTGARVSAYDFQEMAFPTAFGCVVRAHLQGISHAG